MMDDDPFFMPVKTERSLTSRQRDVLSYLAKGLQNKEIAYEMNLSVATVKCHLVDIFLRLSVRTRTAAVVKAHKLGLI